MTLAAEAFMRVTAWRKVSLPRMARVARRSWAFSAVVGQREPPPGIWSRSCREPSEPISVARTEPSPSSPVEAWSTAAPAPSPNRTQVLRSSQLTTVESFSAAMMSAVFIWPVPMYWTAVFMANRKPEQAAEMSKAAAFLAPRASWI